MTEPDDTPEGVSTPEPPQTPPPAPAGPKPIYHERFALVAGGIAAAIGLWIILAAHLFTGRFGLDDRAWDSLGGGGQLAARLMAPVSVLGVVLLLAGAWMAVVEWRGTLKEAAKQQHQGLTVPSAGDVSAVITAVSKLRGAVLLIVVGALMLVLSAWVAKSTADNQNTEVRPGKIMPIRYPGRPGLLPNGSELPQPGGSGVPGLPGYGHLPKPGKRPLPAPTTTLTH